MQMNTWKLQTHIGLDCKIQIIVIYNEKNDMIKTSPFMKVFFSTAPLEIKKIPGDFNTEK